MIVDSAYTPLYIRENHIQSRRGLHSTVYPAVMMAPQMWDHAYIGERYPWGRITTKGVIMYNMLLTLKYLTLVSLYL